MSLKAEITILLDRLTQTDQNLNEDEEELPSGP